MERPGLNTMGEGLGFVAVLPRTHRIRNKLAMAEIAGGGMHIATARAIGPSEAELQLDCGTSMSPETHITQAMRVLKQSGLLMQADASLPSVVTLVVGQPIRGSWWGHPAGDAIHVLNNQLKEHADVIAARLVSRKITYVHRMLWPELFGVVTAGEPWQRSGISTLTRRIIQRVESKGSVRTDLDDLFANCSTSERRAAMGEVEERLLLHSSDLHTERGTHAKLLQTWEECRRIKRFHGRTLEGAESRKRLELSVQSWSAGSDKRATLPWHSQRRIRRPRGPGI